MARKKQKKYEEGIFMSTELQIFNYEGNRVRTVQRDGEPWWVLKDVCAVLGLSNARMIADRLDKDDVSLAYITDSLGRQQQTNTVSEAGLYSVILRSDKPEARRFKRWVTHDVLPAIRRHGMYARDELLGNPDLMIAVLQALKLERSHNAVLEERAAVQGRLIAAMKPKAAYYDVLLACPDAVAVSVVAKDYGWSAIRMNKFLHDCGVQYKQSGIWLLYQKYAGHGYACSRTHEHTGRGGEPHATVHTYWTQKGRLFLYGLLKEHGVLPLVERGKP
jgi:prophage antirepressor-like protein